MWALVLHACWRQLLRWALAMVHHQRGGQLKLPVHALVALAAHARTDASGAHHGRRMHAVTLLGVQLLWQVRLTFLHLWCLSMPVSCLLLLYLLAWFQHRLLRHGPGRLRAVSVPTARCDCTTVLVQQAADDDKHVQARPGLGLRLCRGCTRVIGHMQGVVTQSTQYIS